MDVQPIGMGTPKRFTAHMYCKTQFRNSHAIQICGEKGWGILVETLTKWLTTARGGKDGWDDKVARLQPTSSLELQGGYFDRRPSVLEGGMSNRRFSP